MQFSNHEEIRHKSEANEENTSQIFHIPFYGIWPADNHFYFDELLLSGTVNCVSLNLNLSGSLNYVRLILERQRDCHQRLRLHFCQTPLTCSHSNLV